MQQEAQTEQRGHDAGSVRVVYTTDEGKQVSTYGKTEREAMDRMISAMKVVASSRLQVRPLDAEVVTMSGPLAGETASRAS